MSRFTGLHLAAGVLVASNVFVVGNAWRNRLGQPESDLVLTECELRLRPAHTDVSFASVDLNFENTAPRWLPDPREKPAGWWFDEARLRQLGFDPATATARGDQLRDAFIALAYLDEPPGPLPAARGRAVYRPPDLSAEQQAEVQRRTRSRLTTVDAALDPAELRRRHPDRHKVTILRGRVRMVLDEDRKTVRGAVEGIAREQIHVPAPFAQRLNNAVPGCRYEFDGSSGNRLLRIVDPRFRIRIRTGARYEAWVESLEYK